jgi:hypothetical protein
LRQKQSQGGVRKTKKEKEVARGEVGRALSAGALGVVGRFLVAKRVVQQTQHTTLER